MAVLLDRIAETGAVEGVLAAIRDGLSGVLVLRGEAGIGKTALLDWAAGQAGDMQVVRAAGVQAEMGMGFAGLHRLLIPFLGGLDGLPEPQRQALGSAFGLADGPPPDRFLVGLAALTLLTDAAAERPVLGLVDDAQWLDQVSMQVLGFIARRLYADRAGILFTVREGEEGAAALAGLPELTLDGLPGEVAGELLATSAAAPVDGQVRAQIVAGTAGNPLALVELAGELTAAELAGTVPLSWPLRFGGRLEELYLSRVRALPADTRTLLLVAAAEPAGDPALVHQAAGQLGIDPEAGEATGTERLVSWKPQVRFRHPLIRSAAYYAAPAEARRRAHQALATVTDPDRRAWHLAEAAAGPDEQVAAELERSAGRAQARGGQAAAAAFLERAVRLTADPAHLVERTLAAAQANVQAGAFDKALGLLVMTEARPLDEFAGARVDLLRGQIAFASGQSSDAPPLLLKAARRLEPLNPELARESYLGAWGAALFAGRHAAGHMAEISHAARALRSLRPGPVELLLDGLALLVTDGLAAAAPTLRQAVSAFGRDGISAGDGFRWGWLAEQAAVLLMDDDGWQAILARQVRLARSAGALEHLSIYLEQAGVRAAWSGDFGMAASLIAETEAIGEATGSRRQPYTALLLACLRGSQAEATPLIEAAINEAEADGQGIAVTYARWAAASLCNGLGRYDEARETARQAAGDPSGFYVSTWALPELIEAAARSGDMHMAGGALERLAETTQVCGTDLGLGIEARSRALVAEGHAAEGMYREAIDRLGRTRHRPGLARAHLLYGEWLRRQRRRRDARDQLRTAVETFDAIGMEAFAGRARAELRATGEQARPRSPGIPEVLTPQEAQIARMAAERLSNREIAGQLFISASTVEYHLRKVFRKLHVTSRAELARTIRDDAKTPGWQD